jgi:8-oxo-dGTP pyrophosphatase MutT (NUDIX family)
VLLQFAQKAVIVKDGRFLLVRKSLDDPYNPGKWELPGGRLKEDESLDDALKREVREEVGLDVVPGRPLAIWSWRLGDQDHSPTVVAVARLCTIDTSRVSFDNQDDGDFIDHYGWFDKDQVLRLELIPSAKRPIEESLAAM